MYWLGSAGSSILDIGLASQEADDLDALVQVQGADGTTALDALEKLGQGDEGQLALLDEKQKERLRLWFKEKLQENADIQRLLPLFGTVGDVCAAGEGGNQIKSLDWPLKTAAAGDLQGVGVKMSASGSGQVALKLVACATLPEKAGKLPEGHSALLLDAAGRVELALGAKLPAGRLALSAQVGGQAGLHFQYFSQHAHSERALQALKVGFKYLAYSPFDLERLAPDLRSGLRCLAIQGDGQITLGGSVALASPVALGKAGSLAELAYGYTASLKGDFQYLIQADPEAPNKVLLSLQRSHGDARSHAVSARVGVDLNSAFARLRAETLPLLGEAQNVLVKALDLLEPGKRIKASLQAALEDLDDETGQYLSPLLEALLGFSNGRASLEALSEALTREVAARSLDLRDDVQNGVNSWLEDFLSRLGVSLKRQADIQKKLESRLDAALVKLRADAEADIQRVTAEAGMESIARALEESGLQVQKTLTGMDAALAGTRLLVERYRQHCARLYAALSDSTALKLNASLSYSDSQEQSARVDLRLRFDPEQPEARRVYREALLGAFEGAMALAQDTPGAGVEVLDCRLARSVSRHQAGGLEVAVLGSTVHARTLLSADTDVELDAAGNITLVSHAAMEDRRKLFKEERVLRIADVFELAAARHTRSLKLDVTLSHQDEKLKDKELRGFFDSLEQANLLPPGHAERAAGVLRDIRADTPNCGHMGRLDVRLTLTDGELKQLLGTGLSREVQTQRVTRVASEEMARPFLLSVKRNEKSFLADFGKHYDLNGNLAEIIRAFNDKEFDKKKGGFFDDTGSYNYALKLNLMHHLCAELDKALRVMRELYECEGDDLERLKDPEYCQRKQVEIMLAAKRGSYADFPSLFGAEKVGAATIALFRILAVLAGKSLYSGDVLEATMTLCSGDMKRVRRIA